MPIVTGRAELAHTKMPQCFKYDKRRRICRLLLGAVGVMVVSPLRQFKDCFVKTEGSQVPLPMQVRNFQGLNCRKARMSGQVLAHPSGQALP